jgi:hypothetical protein
VSFSVFVAMCSALVWWWANGEVHPFETMWGYPLAAVSRFIYFGYVVIAGAVVQKKQLFGAQSIHYLATLKEKEVELNALCENEVRLVGRSLSGALKNRLTEMLDGLRALMAEDVKLASQIHGAVQVHANDRTVSFYFRRFDRKFDSRCCRPSLKFDQRQLGAMNLSLS